MTDAGLAPLDGCPDLHGIWLRGCGRVDGTGFDAFGRMPNLSDVSIWNCPLRSDVAFEFLRESDSVRELILAYLSLEDEAMTDIAASPSLEIVRLHELRGVTDAGVRTLSSARRLRNIQIAACAGVSEAAIEHLRASLPNCEIEYDP